MERRVFSSALGSDGMERLSVSERLKGESCGTGSVLRSKTGVLYYVLYSMLAQILVVDRSLSFISFCAVSSPLGYLNPT